MGGIFTSIVLKSVHFYLHFTILRTWARIFLASVSRVARDFTWRVNMATCWAYEGLLFLALTLILLQSHENRNPGKEAHQINVLRFLETQRNSNVVPHHLGTTQTQMGGRDSVRAAQDLGY